MASPKIILYFAHNHKQRTDSHGRDNHQRIAQLIKYCKPWPIQIYHVEEMLRPAEMNYILDIVSNGIDTCGLVAICLTKSYIDAVNQAHDEGDLSKMEFDYLTRRHKSQVFIPLVMERELLDQKLWDGPVGAFLKDNPFIDMSEVQIPNVNLFGQIIAAKLRANQFTPSTEPSHKVARQPTSHGQQVKELASQMQQQAKQQLHAAVQQAQQAHRHPPAAPGPSIHPSKSKVVYFAHNHREPFDSLKRNNLERINALAKDCKQRGMQVYHVEDLLVPAEMNYILDLLSKGIESCGLVILFLTKSYLDAVRQTEDEGNLCKLEFEYIEKRLKPRRVVLVLMEPELADRSKWLGPVGQFMHGAPAINMSQDLDAGLLAGLVASIV